MLGSDTAIDLRLLDFPNTLDSARLRRFFFLLLSMSRGWIVTYTPSIGSAGLGARDGGDSGNGATFSALPFGRLDEWHAEREQFKNSDWVKRAVLTESDRAIKCTVTKR